MECRWSLSLLAALTLACDPVAIAAQTAPAIDPIPSAIIPEAAPANIGGFMVPKAIVLRPLTPAETEANAVWNMRAALNIAALQCQFSPYLNAVRNYNAILKHHSEELTRAQAVMLGHFKRYDGVRDAVGNFDQYTTRTYNSYSTLDAQYSFCGAAGRVGREVLATPLKGMGAEALRLNPEIRASLAETPLSPGLVLTELAPVFIEPIVVPKR